MYNFTKKGEVMCVEKIQMLLLAMALGIIMGLASAGNVPMAFLGQFILMIILIVKALTGKCISKTVLSSAFPLCNKEDK